MITMTATARRNFLLHSSEMKSTGIITVVLAVNTMQLFKALINLLLNVFGLYFMGLASLF